MSIFYSVAFNMQVGVGTRSVAPTASGSSTLNYIAHMPLFLSGIFGA